MAVAIGATEQASVYPPRVVVSVTGLTVGVDFVAVYRRVAGVDTLLRTGQSPAAVDDPSWVVVDAELPFGVPVTYVAYVNNVVTATTSPVTHTLPGGKVALSDAITGFAVETTILAWDTKTRSRQSTVFRVGARNVVVTGDLGQYESQISFFMETDSANQQLGQLLENATEAVVQVRQPGGYAGVDSYFAVTSFDEKRWSQDGSDPRRTWVLQVVETDPWAAALEARGTTLQDIYDFYGPTGTLADLAGDEPTLLAVALEEWA